MKNMAFKFFLFFVLLSGYRQATAQAGPPFYKGTITYNYSGTGTSVSFGTAVDQSGNRYVTGGFSGTVDFDPGAGTANFTSTDAGTDIFITKHNPAGALIWATTLGGVGVDRGAGIAVDENGNVYVSGLFRTSITYNSTTINSNASQDIFLAKLDANKNVQWVNRFGSTSQSEAGLCVATDLAGNVFLGGLYGNSADFDPGIGNNTLSTSDGLGFDAFIAKYSTSGAYIWAKGFGAQNNGSGTTADNVSSLALDQAGNIYCTGGFTGPGFDMDPGAGVKGSNGSIGAYILKLDAGGNYVLGRTIEGGANQASGRGIAVDAAGNFAVTGTTRGTLNVYAPGSGTSQGVITSSNSAFLGDAFITRFSNTGVLVSGSIIGSTADDNGDAVAIDPQGNLFATGYFINAADFDAGPAVETAAQSGSQDIYVLKQNSSGGFVWVRGFGSPNNDRGWQIAVDGAGHIYTSGQSTGTVDYDPINTDVQGSVSLTGFQQKLSQCPSTAISLVDGATQTLNTLPIHGNILPISFFNGCEDILKVQPTGPYSTRINGSIKSSVYIKSTAFSFSGKAYCRRHYDISPANNAANATARVTLYYTQADFDDFNAVTTVLTNKLPANPADAAGIANLRIEQHHGTSVSGTIGTYPGSIEIINPADADIIWNAAQSRWEVTFPVTGFSGFFISTPFNKLLPISLISFTGKTADCKAKLNWEIAPGGSLTRFIVERSTDGSNFVNAGEVAFVPGANGLFYNYEASLQGTRSMWRLKQVDTDGRFTYSDVITLNSGKDCNTGLSARHDIGTNVITVTGLTGSKTGMQLYDASGKLIKSLSIYDHPLYRLDISMVHSGLYVLRVVSADGNTLSLKVLKQ